MRVNYTNVCLCARAYVFVLVCTFVCIFIIPHPAFWESSLGLRERLRIKSQEPRMEGGGILRGPPNPGIPLPHPGAIAPLHSQGTMIGSHLIPIPCVPLCSPPKEVVQRERRIPWRTERWRKGLCGVKRQFAGMPKWESNSKQNILLINKKLSLNNAARSPLTPLDLRLASASFQSKGSYACSTFSSSGPTESLR